MSNALAFQKALSQIKQSERFQHPQHCLPHVRQTQPDVLLEPRRLHQPHDFPPEVQQTHGLLHHVQEPQSRAKTPSIKVFLLHKINVFPFQHLNSDKESSF